MVATLKKLLPHESGAAAIAVAHRVLTLDPLEEAGHRALWETRSATALLLGLAAILVLLIAATVQTGERAAELPRWRIIVIAVSALAPPTALAFGPISSCRLRHQTEPREQGR
jgi:hypothetical protein